MPLKTTKWTSVWLVSLLLSPWVKNELYVIYKMFDNQVAILAYTNSIVSTTPADIIRPRSKMTQNKYKNKCMEQIREVKYYMSSYNNLHQGVWGIKTEVLYTLRYY